MQNTYVDTSWFYGMIQQYHFEGSPSSQRQLIFMCIWVELTYRTYGFLLSLADTMVRSKGTDIYEKPLDLQSYIMYN
jgi:hypothetical protein